MTVIPAASDAANTWETIPSRAVASGWVRVMRVREGAAARHPATTDPAPSAR
jgi:hypothetical protein